MIEKTECVDHNTGHEELYPREALKLARSQRNRALVELQRVVDECYPCSGRGWVQVDTNDGTECGATARRACKRCAPIREFLAKMRGDKEGESCAQ